MAHPYHVGTLSSSLHQAKWVSLEPWKKSNDILFLFINHHKWCLQLNSLWFVSNYLLWFIPYFYLFPHSCTLFSWPLHLWLITLMITPLWLIVLTFHPYPRTVYIEVDTHCKNPNLALLKYTWVSGQVPRTFHPHCLKSRHSSVLSITSPLSHL